MDNQEVVVDFLILAVPLIILIRLRKVYYAFYLESRKKKIKPPVVVKSILEMRQGYVAGRKDWAEKVIEQEKLRKSN